MKFDSLSKVFQLYKWLGLAFLVLFLIFAWRKREVESSPRFEDLFVSLNDTQKNNFLQLLPQKVKNNSLFLNHSEGKGTVYFLFWAKWCDLCQNEMTNLQLLASKDLPLIFVEVPHPTRTDSIAKILPNFPAIVWPKDNLEDLLVPGVPYHLVFNFKVNRGWQHLGPLKENLLLMPDFLENLNLNGN